MKAIFNNRRSRKRNSERGRNGGRAYGFAADMRLRLEAMFQAFVSQFCREHPRVKNWTRINRAFYGTMREKPIRYYGEYYTLWVCNPYVVVTSDFNNEVCAVFPCQSQMALVSQYDAKIARNAKRILNPYALGVVADGLKLHDERHRVGCAKLRQRGIKPPKRRI